MPPAAPSSLAALADASRCSHDAVCRRVHVMEPGMPLSPDFLSSYTNPCFAPSATAQPVCLPYVHIISGWHMFSEESLGFLKHEKGVETRAGLCFDDWATDDGGAKWAASWGAPPPSGSVIMTHCNKLLTWYPAFAGRYTSAWGKTYGPCKEREVAKGGDYYGTKMWPICRPNALAAHDAAMGTKGAGLEATPPFVMKAMYGARVRVVSALRNPVDRLETSFWMHTHYPRKYGSSPEGFHAYAKEQSQAFDACIAKHGTRRCAHLFELLGKEYSEVFFHCDQLIRGLYQPFVTDWHAAFGSSSLLVLRTEDLLDSPAATRSRLLRFIGLPDSPAPTRPASSYAALHAQSLRGVKAQPMLNATRALLEAFYRPHNQALASLLGEPALAWPRGSTVVDAAGIAGAAGGRKNFDRRYRRLQQM